MMEHVATKVAAAACAASLALVLGGCAQSASNSATDEQKANRAYMSQIHEVMVELDDQLDLFVDATSRGDVVNMRTQATSAYKQLDKLADIEAPDELKSVKESYVNGTAKLREALNAYIDLYADVAKSGEDVDEKAYNAQIAEIQALYDEGLALLQKGDTTAAGETASSQEAASSQIAAPSDDASSASSGSEETSSSAVSSAVHQA